MELSRTLQCRAHTQLLKNVIIDRVYCTNALFRSSILTKILNSEWPVNICFHFYWESLWHTATWILYILKTWRVQNSFFSCFFKFCSQLLTFVRSFWHFEANFLLWLSRSYKNFILQKIFLGPTSTSYIYLQWFVDPNSIPFNISCLLCTQGECDLKV